MLVESLTNIFLLISEMHNLNTKRKHYFVDYIFHWWFFVCASKDKFFIFREIKADKMRKFRGEKKYKKSKNGIKLSNIIAFLTSFFFPKIFLCFVDPIYLTPPLGQDMTQG